MLPRLTYLLVESNIKLVPMLPGSETHMHPMWMLSLWIGNSYIFPPCLVGRCLVLEQPRAIVIVPLWTTQTWFTSILTLLVDVPRTFRVTKKVLSPLHPSVNDVFKFLHTFRVNELSYSTINTARSVLSSYLMGYEFPGCHYTVANHHFIVRYLKGVFNGCKPAPRYLAT